MYLTIPINFVGIKMIRLTTKGQYGARLMIQLAMNYGK